MGSGRSSVRRQRTSFIRDSGAFNRSLLDLHSETKKAKQLKRQRRRGQRTEYSDELQQSDAFRRLASVKERRRSGGDRPDHPNLNFLVYRSSNMDRYVRMTMFGLLRWLMSRRRWFWRVNDHHSIVFILTFRRSLKRRSVMNRIRIPGR